MKNLVMMSDLSSRRQLYKGFYDVEGGRWRWTGKEFAVMFPGGSPATTHILTLHFFVPDTQIQSLGAVTLAANVNGSAVEPETYRQAGTYEYSRSIPNRAFNSNIVPVVFSLDRATASRVGEPRELGIVVNAVEIRAN